MSKITCVATYATDPLIADVIPWIQALQDLVALGLSKSTELREVKICLYACRSYYRVIERYKTPAYQNQQLIPQQSNPGVLQIIFEVCIQKRGHWSPWTCISPLFSLALILEKMNTMNGLILQITSTHSGLSQFTPAGQSSEPVVSWWKPWSNFILQLSGGVITWPGGHLAGSVIC